MFPPFVARREVVCVDSTDHVRQIIGLDVRVLSGRAEG